MKIKKQMLCPQRLRRIPGQFSWIDQRLVRDRYLQQEEKLTAPQIARQLQLDKKTVGHWLSTIIINSLVPAVPANWTLTNRKSKAGSRSTI